MDAPRSHDSPNVVESGDPYRLAFLHSPDGIVITRPDGQYVDANPAALALLGYTREELLHRHGHEIMPPQPFWTAERYAQFLRDGWWEGDAELRTARGPLRIGLRVVALGEADGGLQIVYFQDPRQRQMAEETRARLAALVNSAPDAIISETLDGVITDWNPAAERLYGYTAEEAIGQPFTMLIPPEQAPEIAQILERVQLGEHVANLETTRLTREGGRVDVSLSVFPVWNDARQIIATSVIVRDITERRAQEAALAASEERFRVAFEDAPIGMALAAPDTTVLQVNRALCQFLSATEGEIKARTLWGMTHPDDVAANRQLVERALSGEIDTFDMEKRYVRPDGQIVWGRLSVSLIRHEDGAPRYFITQVQDITERKAAQAELAATQQRATEILERISDGFAAFDREWCYTYLNAAAERVLGRSRESLLGQSFWDVFPLAHMTPLATEMRQVMASGVPSTIETFWPLYDLWYENRLYPTPTGLLIFFRDITDRRQHGEAMEAALEAAETASRTQSRFVAMMSHELRTPLQAVMGNAEFLLATATGVLTEEQVADVQAIRQGALRMADLIEQVLDLSRLEAGVLQVAHEAVDLAPLLQQARDGFSAPAADNGLTLDLDIPKRLPRVSGDPMRIRQILLCLAGNAVKFTEQGGVRISAAQDGHGVAVAVADTGIGIEPAGLSTIFEAFQQAESDPLRRYEGAGLGLAMARRLAEQMGGHIRVTSEPGAGSTFTVWLPRAPRGRERASRAAEHPRQAGSPAPVEPGAGVGE